MDTLKSLGSNALNKVTHVGQKASEAAGSVTQFVQAKANKVLGEQKPAAATDLKEGGTGMVSLASQDQAEDAVKANTARKQNTDFNTLQDPGNRKSFVQNITQLDGARNGVDGQSCGPTALVAGITMADPESSKKLAGGILDQNSSDRKEMFGNNPLDKDDAAALRRIRDGNASPADMQVMAQVMASSKGVNTGNGTSPDEMGRLVGNASKLMGGKMPNMELHMFADAKDPKAGGHWQAYANGTEIDPWPNDQGQATLTEGPAGLAQGAQHFTNGSVHTKMIIQNEGKDIHMPRYLGLDAQGNRVANADPNQPLTNYHYKQDWIGYGYSRSAGEIPAGVDPNQEPDKEMGQTIK